MSNLTIKVDDDLLRRARGKAAEQGTSLSAVVGELLEQ
jgi:predicted HicB family RNase H-like nuclease